MHDRTYWRCEDSKRLIAEARDSDHELCIALGERLEQLAGMEDMLSDALTDVDRLTLRVEELTREVQTLEAALDAEP